LDAAARAQPALGAEPGFALQSHQDEHAQRCSVDEPLTMAEPAVVDCRDEQHEHQAAQAEHRLSEVAALLQRL